MNTREFGLEGLESVMVAGVLSLQDAATRAIRTAILSRELKPGTPLLQVELAARLGVSRQPVREALRRLEAEGLIRSYGTRYLVTEYSDEEVRENYFLRGILEAEGARLAAVRVSDDVLHELESIVARQQYIGDIAESSGTSQLAELINLNERFHALIHTAGRMPTLTRLIQALWVGHTVLTPLFVEGRAARSRAEHADVLTQLRKHDAEGAADAMRRHIEAGSRDYFDSRSYSSTNSERR